MNQPNFAICPRCHAKLIPGGKYCHECGAPSASSTNPTKDASHQSQPSQALPSQQARDLGADLRIGGRGTMAPLPHDVEPRGQGAGQQPAVPAPSPLISPAPVPQVPSTPPADNQENGGYPCDPTSPAVPVGPPFGPNSRPLLFLQLADDSDMYPLTKDATLGQASDCDLVIENDQYVSRHHARIYCRDGNVYVEDAGSSNGTLLRICRPTELQPGDEIVIGTSVVRLSASCRNASPQGGNQPCQG